MAILGYVTTGGGVWAFDPSTNTTITPAISTSFSSWWAAVTPDNKFVYYTTRAGQTVVPYDTTLNTFGTPVNLGSNTYGIAICPNGTQAYVATDAGVYPIDLPGNTVGTVIPYGVSTFAGDIQLCITPDSTQAYVCDASDVIQFSIPGNVASFAFGGTGYPQAVAVSPDGTKLYCTFAGNTITVVSPISNTVTNHIALTAQPGYVCFDPGTSGLAFVNYNASGQFQPITWATDTLGTIQTLSPGSATPIGMEVFDETLYIADNNNGVRPITLPSLTQLTPIHAPTGITQNPITVAFGPFTPPPPTTSFPKLFIPRKGFPKYEQRDYGINFRAIERWANSL